MSEILSLLRACISSAARMRRAAMPASGARPGLVGVALLLGLGGVFPLAASADSVATSVEARDPIQGAQALIRRVLPWGADAFECQLIPAAAGRDVFEYATGSSGRIVLRGNNAIVLAVAFNQYLRRVACLDFDWLATQALAPGRALPRPRGTVHEECAARERFFLNYCTYGYTFPWWKWEQWQRFLDWMAMNGINRPLLQAGQEAVWLRVWQQYGITPDEIRGYFPGPAHLPWHRMANLDRWGGPLPNSYLEEQEQLERQIVTRARELGMRPILPAFAGHVPPELARVRPAAKITAFKPGWSGMAAEYATHYLDPGDPLFAEIQGRFLREQTALYGTDHLYAADPFNEMTPPSWEPKYLAGVAASIYGGIAAADPQARWYQMTWTFTYDKLDGKWTPERLSAMLHAVPAGRMVLLDYAGEEREFFRETEDCYGLPFVWNYLGNFGGNTHLMAPLQRCIDRESRALQSPNCIGVGSTLEAFGVNPVIYELLLEQAWQSNGPVDLTQWVDRYARCRGGQDDPALVAAWRQLAGTVFINNSRRTGTNGSVFQAMPPVPSWHGRSQNTRTDYRPGDLVTAVGLMFQARPETRAADGYRFDVVNLTRQVLCNAAVDVAARMNAAFAGRDLPRFRAEAKTFLELGSDLDELLGTRPEFLLGSWLAEARAWGRSPAEADYYESNARQIITSWHQPGGELTDYASRQWNGLLRGYYLPRWTKWIELADESLQKERPLPDRDYVAWVNRACEQWIRARGEPYLTQPQGDPVEMAERLFRKYSVLWRRLPGAAQSGP